MRTLIHLVGVLLVAGSLWLALSMLAVAGYGNHAERATVNIQTRVEIGKLSLQN